MRIIQFIRELFDTRITLETYYSEWYDFKKDKINFCTYQITYFVNNKYFSLKCTGKNYKENEMYVQCMRRVSYLNNNCSTYSQFLSELRKIEEVEN